MKKLIINADDFGLSSGTNAAIIECHQTGSVSSTTLMVNMPFSEDAAALAKKSPELGVGLHLNLTSAFPICRKEDVASLLDNNGQFFLRSAAEKRVVSGHFKSAEVRRELEAQWTRFLSFGLSPTHLDSHQHIHIYPAVFDVVASFCIEKGLPLRIPWVWKPPTGVSLSRRFRMWMLKRMVKRNMKRWGGKLKINKSFASIFDLQLKPEDVSMESYRSILQFDHAGFLELMVHPSDADEEHGQMTGISEISAREYEILKSSNLSEVARGLGYEVINYSQL